MSHIDAELGKKLDIALAADYAINRGLDQIILMIVAYLGCIIGMGALVIELYWFR